MDVTHDDVFIRTLSPIQRVPVPDQGSKILFVKFGAMKTISGDLLNEEYPVIDLGNKSE